jgi:hypothetical protein
MENVIKIINATVIKDGQDFYVIYKTVQIIAMLINCKVYAKQMENAHVRQDGQDQHAVLSNAQMNVMDMVFAIKENAYATKDIVENFVK